MNLRFAVVFGWGAVEKKAAEWAEDASAEEVEPRLWEVRQPGNGIIGYIGKEPWTANGIEIEGMARFADALSDTQCGEMTP